MSFDLDDPGASRASKVKLSQSESQKFSNMHIKLNSTTNEQKTPEN